MAWEFIARELADMLGVLAHPQRIRIIESLRDGEQDVSTLQGFLGVSQSQVSQHLALLRARRLVIQRKSGRHRFYRLADPRIAEWMLDGVKLLESELNAVDQLRTAVQQIGNTQAAEAARAANS
ncbi:MAG: ArsR/SmtB family transcription factor [Bradymonadia bacterium]